MPIDPHDPMGRMPAFAKDRNDETFLDALNHALSAASLPAANTSIDPSKLPLLYVVGAPRSGTTLLSQLLSRCLPVGYINNLIARFWLRPSAGIRLSRLVLGADARKDIVLNSTHGVTPGISGPHEFGYFWRHWLALDSSATHHLSAAALLQLDQDGLKDALEEEILRPFNAPVVFKNAICGFHARFLTNVHQRSLFVHIVRDPYETCASVLNTRRQRYGTYDAWWSLKPSTYPFDPRPASPEDEVVRQVIDSRRDIGAELHHPEVRSLQVEYESLCADPRREIGRVCQAIRDLGTTLSAFEVDLSTVARTRGTSLPSDLETRLRVALAASEADCFWSAGTDR